MNRWFTVVDKRGRTVAVIRSEEHAKVFVRALGDLSLHVLRSTAKELTKLREEEEREEDERP